MIHTNPCELAHWTLVALQDGAPTGVLGADSGSAATGDPAGGAGGSAPASPGGGLGMFMMPLLLMMVVFMMLSATMSGRKEKKKRAEMLSNIGRRDRIQTVGGVIGTIIEIKGDELLIESDRTSNTRLWVTRGSVSSIVRSGGEKTGESTSEKSTEPASV